MSGRVLILGSTGQVGSALMARFQTRDIDVRGTGYTRAADLPLDLGDPDAVRDTLEAARPDLILVVGAYTHVDGCEQDPEKSRRVNNAGPRAAVEWAAAHGARVVLYSTDYVFDGEDGPYGEDDAVHPLSRYGADKRAAEEAVLELKDRGLVLRTAWVYSWEDPPKNFMQRLALNLAAGNPARIPSDQWGNPTYAPDLARATDELVVQGASGVFHVAGEDILTRADFARLIARTFGLSETLITGVPTAQLAQPAARPLRAGLRVEKCRDQLGWVPRGAGEVLPAIAAAHPLLP